MGIGVSVFLVTLGAILRYGITVEVSGVNIEAIGMILMAVGVGWFIVSLVLLRRRGAEGQNPGAYRSSELPSDREPPAV